MPASSASTRTLQLIHRSGANIFCLCARASIDPQLRRCHLPNHAHVVITPGHSPLPMCTLQSRSGQFSAPAPAFSSSTSALRLIHREDTEILFPCVHCNQSAAWAPTSSASARALQSICHTCANIFCLRARVAIDPPRRRCHLPSRACFVISLGHPLPMRKLQSSATFTPASS